MMETKKNILISSVPEEKVELLKESITVSLKLLGIQSEVTEAPKEIDLMKGLERLENEIKKMRAIGITVGTENIDKKLKFYIGQMSSAFKRFQEEIEKKLIKMEKIVTAKKIGKKTLAKLI